MGETPDDIREEIEETRARMGDTAEAIGYKADVKSRMRESVVEKKDSFVGSIGDGSRSMVERADSLVSRVGGVVPGTDEMKHGAAKVGVSKENPVGLAVAGAAVGFVIGTLLPRTQTEDEKLGAISDDVTDKAKEAAHEAIDRGKSVAQETLDAATTTAQQSSERELQGMSSSVQESAQDIGSRDVGSTSRQGIA